MSISTAQIPLALALNYEIMKLSPAYSKKIMLVGGSGVGKTQSVERYARIKKCNFIQLNLGQFEDVGDILGLPYTVEINGKTYKKTAMDDFYAQALDPDKNTVVFLDEVGVAPNSIKNALLTFLQNGTLGGLELDLSKTEIILATNDVYNQEYSQNDDSNKAFLGRILPLELFNSKQSQLNYFFSKYDSSNPLLQFYLELNKEDEFYDKVKDIDQYIIETGRSAEDSLMLYEAKDEAIKNVLNWIQSLDSKNKEEKEFLTSINYIQSSLHEFKESLEKTASQLVRHTMSKNRWKSFKQYLESKKMNISLNPSVFMSYKEESCEYRDFMDIEGITEVQATINLFNLLNERYKEDNSSLLNDKETKFLIKFYETKHSRRSDFQTKVRQFVINKEIECDNFDLIINTYHEDFVSNKIENIKENTSLN